MVPAWFSPKTSSAGYLLAWRKVCVDRTTSPSAFSLSNEASQKKCRPGIDEVDRPGRRRWWRNNRIEPRITWSFAEVQPRTRLCPVFERQREGGRKAPSRDNRARRPLAGIQPALAMATAVSGMRLAKPHSLSYQLSTRTKLPSMTWVCVESNDELAALWLKSIDTRASSM